MCNYNHIVCHSRNYVIGINNKLPWSFASDLRFFKKQTIGKTCVMGRKTFMSIGKPLPDRLNVILTQNPERAEEVVEISKQHGQGVMIFSDIDAMTASSDVQGHSDIMIIGGAQIYAQTIPLVSVIYETEVDLDIDGDAFYPNIPSHFVCENEEKTTDVNRLTGEKVMLTFRKWISRN